MKGSANTRGGPDLSAPAGMGCDGILDAEAEGTTFGGTEATSKGVGKVKKAVGIESLAAFAVEESATIS